MRIYIPSTSTLLASFAETGVLSGVPLTAFGVTPGLREWYADDDIEELEYAASAEAARASLRLIGADSHAAPRRVVIAADVADTDVDIRDDLDRGVVRARVVVVLSACASVHVDDVDAEAVVGAAARAIDAADLGDSEAEELVDDAQGFELSWYATQEIALLVEEFAQ